MTRALRVPLGRIRRFFAGIGDARAVRARVEAARVLAPIVPGRDGSPAQGASVRPRPVSARRSASDPLRIGLVVDSLDKGGLEEVVSLLARSLPAVGVGTSVLCARAGGHVARRLRGAGVDVEVLGGRLDRVSAWAERTGVAAASSHFAPVELVERLASVGVPVVETVQNTYAWMREPEWARERRRVRALRGVIAVSRTAGAYFLEHAGRATDWIVPNAVDPGRAARVPRTFARRRLGLDPGAPLFVFVGRITEQKNPAGLVAAFARTAERLPDAVLLLAGPADRSGSVGRLRRRYRSLFDRGAVRHVADPAHVGTVLSAADAFVSTSFYEGWSVAASEGAWVGLPLVLSEVGGSRGLVGEDAERGWIVPNPAGDPLAISQTRISDPPAGARRANEEALARALDEVTARRDEWVARAGDIRAWARAELSPRKIADRYGKILRDVAGR